MNANVRDSPLYRLTRHFFSELFDLGFLSDEGTEGFHRLVIGVCVMFFSFGLVLVRVFMGQYAYLASLPSPEPLRNALLAGNAFAMALPMWAVAFVTVLVSHALFPGETDFRVLVPLPISKRLVFGAKLLALALFAALFILATQVALVPLAWVMAMRAGSDYFWVVRLAAFVVASVAASVWAVFVITSINGLLVLAASRGRLMGFSAALRSLMLAVLVLTLPFVNRLTAQGPAFAADAGSLYFSPPAWFVGVAQVLLGHTTPLFLRLTGLAMVGLAVTIFITVGIYALLYRHFERVTRRPAESRSSDSIWRRAWPLRASRRASPYLAVRSFTAITLRRSALHQGVLVFVSAIGVGVAVSSLAGSVLSRIHGDHSALLMAQTTIIWATLVVVLFTTMAARGTLTLPTEQRANWVFRMTEEASARVQELRAAMRAVTTIGVGFPLVALAPLHWQAFGEYAVVTLLATGLCGLLLVELLMKNWARVPFSCSYIPGKQFVPLAFLSGLGAFIVFTVLGSGLLQLNLLRPRQAVYPDAVIMAVVLILRHRRRARWKEQPLMFDDVLPTEVNPLRLSMD